MPINSMKFFLLTALFCAIHLLVLDLNQQKPSDLNLLTELKSREISDLQFELPSQNGLSPKGLYHPYPGDFISRETPVLLLKATIRYAKSCATTDLEKLETQSRTLGLYPSKILMWHKSVCEKDFSDFKIWMDRAPYMHPSGKSYALMYEDKTKNRSYREFLHIAERQSRSSFIDWYLDLPAGQQLKVLNLSEIDALHSKQIVYTTQEPTKTLIHSVGLETINRFLQSRSLVLERPSQLLACPAQVYGFCIYKLKRDFFSWLLFRSNVFFLYFFIFLVMIIIYHLVLKKMDEIAAEAEQAFLLQTLSHEVRTPLTSIQLSLGDFKKDFDQMSEHSQKALMSILDQSAHLNKVFEQTLGELKKDNTLKVVDLNSFVSDYVLQKYGADISVTEFSKPLPVKTSMFWLEILLSNLINNALKHGATPVEVRLGGDLTSAWIEVKDNGVLEQSEMRNLFKAYYKGSMSGGLGLGLYILRKKMQDFGGQLTVNNNPTRFRLTFPGETSS